MVHLKSDRVKKVEQSKCCVHRHTDTHTHRHARALAHTKQRSQNGKSPHYWRTSIQSPYTRQRQPKASFTRLRINSGILRRSEKCSSRHCVKHTHGLDFSIRLLYEALTKSKAVAEATFVTSTEKNHLFPRAHITHNTTKNVDVFWVNSGNIRISYSVLIETGKEKQPSRPF